MQQDWIGAGPPGQFKDIRPTRPSSAEEKATQLLRLGALINRIPQRIAQGGSVEDVRAWKRDRSAAAKVAANSRASVNDISAATRNTQKWWSDSANTPRARAFEQQGEKAA